MTRSGLAVAVAVILGFGLGYSVRAAEAAQPRLTDREARTEARAHVMRWINLWRAANGPDGRWLHRQTVTRRIGRDTRDVTVDYAWQPAGAPFYLSCAGTVRVMESLPPVGVHIAGVIGTLQGGCVRA